MRKDAKKTSGLTPKQQALVDIVIGVLQREKAKENARLTKQGGQAVEP